MEADKCAAGLLDCLISLMLLAGVWAPSFNIKVFALDLNSHNHHCVILSVPGEQGDVYHIRKETAAVTLGGQNFNKAVLI